MASTPAAAPRAANSHHHIVCAGGAEVWIGRDLDLGAAEREQVVQQIADLVGDSAGYVHDGVRRELRGPLDPQHVGLDHVAHVQHVAHGLQVADLDPRRLQPGFDAGDLGGEPRHHEALRLAGAGVVEKAVADRAQPLSHERPQQQVGRRLGHRVVAGRRKQRGLGERRIERRRAAVDQAGAGEQQRALRRLAQDAQGDGVRAPGVDVPGRLRIDCTSVGADSAERCTIWLGRISSIAAATASPSVTSSS